MHIQLIRNATLKIRFGGKCFLIDPYFAPKHSQPSFAGKSPNPVVDLPLPVADILHGVDYVLISHLHPDHFDDAARDLLPKDSHIFCNPPDEATLRDSGFTHVCPVHDFVDAGGVRIHRSDGHHGEGSIESIMGLVCGFVFAHPDEKTLYWAGDTVWCQEVREAIRQHAPEVIVCHAGGNRFFKEHPLFGDAFSGDSAPVIMDASQAVQVCRHMPSCDVIATHVGALDHETETRDSLQRTAESSGTGRLHVPLDGQVLVF